MVRRAIINYAATVATQGVVAAGLRHDIMEMPHNTAARLAVPFPPVI
jgi:hypothetical protein